MNEREDFSAHFDGSTRGWVRKPMEFCKGAIRLRKEHKSTFFIQEVIELCLVIKKGSDFRPHICLLSLCHGKRLSSFSKGTQPFSMTKLRKLENLHAACKFSNFRSIFLFPEGKNFKVFTVRKFGQKTVVFIKYIIRFLPCTSYRRFPSFIWRKTCKRWFPWILAQNKTICFSYRCGQYRD